MDPNIEQFMASCRSSSSEAYQQFKGLLARLDNVDTRRESRQFLTQLKQAVKNASTNHFLFLEQTIFAHNDEKRTLSLLQFPSTFEPEAWSLTFYEGLIRYPASEFQGVKMIELGCGIGWITLAIALRYHPDKIIGSDINPKAVICARLNLYLAALTDTGEPIEMAGEKSLLDSVSFIESNLCQQFLDEPDSFDCIIGCIPQVLNPEPEVMNTLIAESASDEYLQSLSNYAVQQGYIEDQFGLGLIARALEEGILLIKRNGKMILNLGGRPSRVVLENMMERRGYNVRRVWHNQVKQAADTDIKGLVAIEKSTGHQFEFFMSNQSTNPIDARTALAYQQQRGDIYHSVVVYEARMSFPQPVKSIYREIREIDSKQLYSAVDLTYPDFDFAEERHSFLSFLIVWLKKQSVFVYEDNRGLIYFRQQLAEYLYFYHDIVYQESQILITPGRSELIANLLSTYRPALTLVDKSLRHLISRELDTDESEIINTPTNLEHLIVLIETLKPHVVITQLKNEETHSVQMIQTLIDTASAAESLLIIDMTDVTYLSSDPKNHAIYRYLSTTYIPDNLIVTFELINNLVYDNYSVNIALVANPTINQELANVAELTYSRTAVLPQLYYGHLLEELLYFQRTRNQSDPSNNAHHKPAVIRLALANAAHNAMLYPTRQNHQLAITADTLRLNYAENYIKSPALLKHFLFESYLVRHINQSNTSPDKPIRELLEKRFGLSPTIYAKMAFFNGISPLLETLLRLCQKADKTLLMPNGNYNNVAAIAAYLGVKVQLLAIDEQHDFKITPPALKAALIAHPNSCLLLNGPVVNPTGAVYSNQQLTALLSVVAEHQATVILDTIFSGLEFAEPEQYQLKAVMDSFSHKTDSQFVLIGGIAKEYAAGGLRFAYAWSPSSQLMDQLDDENCRQPHETLQYAVKKLFESHNQQDEPLVEHLAEQRQLLLNRATRLTDVLSQQGWQVITPKGGLFLVAKPQQYIDQHQVTAIEGANAVAKKLFEQCNIVINDASWTGLPGFCRFVLSTDENTFEQALLRLTSFKL